MVAKILIFLVISFGIYLSIAIGLILSQRPAPLSGAGGLAFERLVEAGAPDPLDEVRFTTRNGSDLGYRLAPGPDRADAPLLIMVHGSGWYGGQFDRLARELSDLAEVRAITLRGHGADPERRGDVDHIGQLEEDLADLIAGAGDRRVILLGHSSGGGLVTRFAGGDHAPALDGVILLAPFLQYDAPTTRPGSGGWATTLTRRMIGLSMLNRIGIHALDGLTVIQFAMPQAVLDGPLGGYATTAYSWRLNQSYAPRRDYLADIAALPPFLLIAGDEDEAMVAGAYETTMSQASDVGSYHVLKGAGHLDIVDDPRTRDLIRDLLR